MRKSSPKSQMRSSRSPLKRGKSDSSRSPFKRGKSDSSRSTLKRGKSDSSRSPLKRGKSDSSHHRSTSYSPIRSSHRSKGVGGPFTSPLTRKALAIARKHNKDSYCYNCDGTGADPSLPMRVGNPAYCDDCGGTGRRFPELAKQITRLDNSPFYP